MSADSPTRARRLRLLGAVLAVGLLAAPSPPPARDRGVPAAAGGGRVDRFGDPLPAGALARIGTVRLQQGSSVHSLCYSPDGKLLASAGGDSTARLWDVATGREVRRFVDPKSEWIGSVAISPDGKTLVTGGRTVRVWDVASGQEAYGLPYRSANVALSQDGKTLAVAAGEGIHVWDLAQGRELRQVKCQGGFSVAFAPDCTAAAVAGAEGVRRVDLIAGKETMLLEKHLAYFLSFSPDGKTLVTGHYLRGTDLWDAATGRRRLRLPAGTDACGTLVDFSPDGKLLALAGDSGPPTLWDAATGRKLHRCWIDSRTTGALAFAPDGKTLAAAGRNGRIQFVDVATGEPRMPFAQPPDVFGRVVFGADGRWLLTTEDPEEILPVGAVCLWDAATGKLLHQYRCDARSGRVEPSADGTVVAAFDMPELRFFQATAGVRSGELHGEHGYRTYALSGDGARVATTNPAGGTIRVWDRAARKELRRIPGRAELTRLVLSPDGTAVAAASVKLIVSRNGHSASGVEDADGTFRVWDVVTGRERWKRSDVRSQTLAFSPDGQWIATSGQAPAPDGDIAPSTEVRLWDAATGADVWVRQRHTQAVAGFAFTRDGRTLATAAMDGEVCLWEVATGGVRRSFRAHEGGVLSVSFSPDGGRLATAGEDRKVLVWDLTEGAAPLSAREAEVEWEALASGDAARAYAAVRRLAGDPARAVPLLAARLRPVAAADAGRVAALIADLDGDRFAAREAASQELAGLGDVVVPALRRALASGPGPEARRRLNLLLEEAGTWPPGRLRPWRALEVLERIGTPEARRVLQSLAGGLAGTRLTDGARDSLARLARPAPAP